MLLSLLAAGCIEAPSKLSNEEYLKQQEQPVADIPPLPPQDVDGPADVTDSGPPPDTGPPPDPGPPEAGCVYDPLIGDWCDGLDNDCDGETDEDGGPPEVVDDFTAPRGWLRTSPGGNTEHVTGLVSFAGYPDVETIVWLRTVEWRGDIELDVRLILSQVFEGGELFVGAWHGDAAPLPSEAVPPARTGISIVRNGPDSVTVRALVDDVVAAQTTAGPTEFLRVTLRLTTRFQRATLRLLRGDGSLVAEAVGQTVIAIPTYSGLAMAVSGAPVVGSVTQVGVGPGLECSSVSVPGCMEGEKCPPVPPCAVLRCNPFLGCAELPKTCPLESDCFSPSTCDPEADACSEQVPKEDGLPCDNGVGCTAGSTCLAGECAGGEPVVCPEPGECQEAGVCVAAINACVFAPKGEGLPCSDGSECTEADQCLVGECVGTPKECPTNSPCESESVCDAGTGECSEITQLPDGAECDDSDGCTTGDLCLEGQCTGEPNPCDDGIECTEGTCADGLCTYVASAEQCLAWEADVGAPVVGPPAWNGGAALFVAAGALHALTLKGDPVWSSEEVLGVTSPTPAVTFDGLRLLAGDVTVDGGVARAVAVSALDGSLEWAFPIPGECVPGNSDPCRITAILTEGPDGTAYVPTFEAGLYAVTPPVDDEEPTLLWHLAETFGGTSLVVAKSGVLYIGQGGPPRGVLALTPSGKQRWLHPTDADVLATPIVDGDTIYWAAGEQVGRLTDAGDTATPEWTLDLQAALGATQPVLASAGTLLVGSLDAIVAIDTAACDGTQELCVLWSAPMDGPGIGLGLTAMSDGLVSFGSASGTLVFQGDPEIQPGWSLPLDGATPTAPVILDNDLLVVGAADGKLRALVYATGVTPAASAWPVMNRHQGRNTASKPE